MAKRERVNIGGRDYVLGAKKKHVDYIAQENREKREKKRQAEFHRAGVLYKRFKTALFATETRPEDLAGRFLALRDKLSKEIKSRRVRAICLEMLDNAIEKSKDLYGLPEAPEEGK